MFKHLASLTATAVLVPLTALIIVRPIQAQGPPVRNIVLVHGISHPKEVAALIEDAATHAR
jgi:hypothetical protein